MYEIKPESVKTYIEDTSIRLPRFQRKQTWSDEQNFRLCVSLFRGYPLGVTILSVQDLKGKPVRWLLDGRQRRYALGRIHENPEHVYDWARKYIKFARGATNEELEDKYWAVVMEYLEEDTADSLATPSTTPSEADISETDDAESEGGDDDAVTTRGDNLDLLLRIIRACHTRKPASTGFTRPFDFKPLIDDLPYAESNEGKRVLNGKKLVSFIGEFRNYCRDNSIEQVTAEVFAEYLIRRLKPAGGQHEKIRVEISRRWPRLEERIEIVEEIENQLRGSKIGLIEVKSVSQADEQKIFNIINTGGTPLTAVEILSAKNSWNVPLKSASALLQESAKEIYRYINSAPDGLVRWDQPATLLLRIPNAKLLFETAIRNGDNRGFERVLTHGFKLLTAIYEKGITKNDIEKLSKNASIDWDQDIDALAGDLDLMLKVMSGSTYFQFFKSWRVSIYNLLGDAIALNFAAALYFDWKRKQRPTGGGVKMEQFQKNALVLLDRFLYEQLRRQWRGSGDSRVAQNLLKLDTSTPDLFDAVETAKWELLLTELIDEGKLDEQAVSDAQLRPLLYHTYSLLNLAGPDQPGTTGCEVDHIIPQALFKVTAEKKPAAGVQDNLCNLALLPKSENASKSDRRLVEIDDPWLKDQIRKYAFVEESTYSKFSRVEGLPDLIRSRRIFFERAFKEKRSTLLS